MFKKIPCLFLALICMLPVPHLSQAQTPPPPTEFEASLPIEVAMLYYSTLKTPPKFSVWAAQSPVVKEVGNGFGADAVLEQERQRLSQLYKKIGQQKTIFYTAELTIDPSQSGPEQIKFKDLDPDSPIMYDDFSGTYAVFVRNFDKYETLKAPFEFMNAPSIANILSTNTPVRAEIVLKAVAADKNPLEISPGTPALMLLADIMEINLVDNKSNVLVQKRYAGWQKGSDLKNLFGGSAPLGSTLSNQINDPKAMLEKAPASTDTPNKN
jgi:hypothetical protein